MYVGKKSRSISQNLQQPHYGANYNHIYLPQRKTTHKYSLWNNITQKKLENLKIKSNTK